MSEPLTASAAPCKVATEPHRMNCWEFGNCGRQPGGENALVLGVCPTSIDESADGLNGGRNGGRICWAVAGHFSQEGEIRWLKARDLATCMSCAFFRQVLREEGIYTTQVQLAG